MIIYYSYVTLIVNYYKTLWKPSVGIILLKTLLSFKNIENPSSIDIILTNKHRSFMHTKVLETGISDHYKFTTTL